jgi:hypothetical protein
LILPNKDHDVFASRIASISITALQYNIPSTVKRSSGYETIGGIFHVATDSVIQLFVTERTRGVLQKLVIIIAEALETDDERVMDGLINQSEDLKQYINLTDLGRSVSSKIRHPGPLLLMKLLCLRVLSTSLPFPF